MKIDADTLCQAADDQLEAAVHEEMRAGHWGPDQHATVLRWMMNGGEVADELRYLVYAAAVVQIHKTVRKIVSESDDRLLKTYKLEWPDDVAVEVHKE